MSSVTVILTCFNRCSMTVNCIKTIKKGNTGIDLSFVVVDDNSTDSTEVKINGLISEGYKIDYLRGTGSLYWAGGMRMGIDYATESEKSDYYLFVNDDVSFEEKIVEDMISEYESKNECKALVGATYDDKGILSYGGIKYSKGIKYDKMGPDYEGICDTFCMNCVLVDRETFFRAGNFDKKYVHSLADFDYGLNISRNIGPIRMFGRYVGQCNDNSKRATWEDTLLSRFKRIKCKESPKGAPFGPWFHFLNKNFGLIYALIYGVRPYFRIIIGR